MLITKQAREYISRRGSVVTIDFGGIGGCCVPIYVPLGELREPDEPDLYQRVESDGITVYYPRWAVIEEAGLRVDLITTGSRSRLDVGGIYRGEAGEVVKS